MRRIGIDRRDPSYRHFYFDDSEVLTSIPPKYKVWYVDDENDVDYIECSNVIKIKDAPYPQEIKENVIKIDSNHDGNADITITSPSKEVIDKVINNVVTDKTEVKKRGRKKKVVDESEVATITDVKPAETQATIQYQQQNNKYEYKAFDMDFSSSTELVDLLNTYGEDGWELCASELYNEGLIFDKKKIFCIMKRIKGLD